MAYNPYERGDNPWLGNLDMPKSQPTARPGASRAASLPAKKAKPKPPALSPQNKKIAAAMKGPLPPVRPVGIGEMQGPPIPADLGAPTMPPPRVTGPESTARLAEPMGPPIPSGLLAGPAATGALPPPSAPGFVQPRTLQNTPFDTGPVTPIAGSSIPPLPPQAPRPTGPQGTPFDTGPVTPMQTPDWLRRLFSGSNAPPGGMPTGIP